MRDDSHLVYACTWPKMAHMSNLSFLSQTTAAQSWSCFDTDLQTMAGCAVFVDKSLSAGVRKDGFG